MKKLAITYHQTVTQVVVTNIEVPDDLDIESTNAVRDYLQEEGEICHYEVEDEWVEEDLQDLIILDEIVDEEETVNIKIDRGDKIEHHEATPAIGPFGDEVYEYKNEDGLKKTILRDSPIVSVLEKVVE
jgi:hypothetical protein